MFNTSLSTTLTSAFPNRMCHVPGVASHDTAPATMDVTGAVARGVQFSAGSTPTSKPIPNRRIATS